MTDVNCFEITDQKDKYELVVLECRKCGFHIGLDASYLEQVRAISLDCPSCKTTIHVTGE